MSNPRLKLLSVPPPPRTITGAWVPWTLGSARPNESVRWECVDGRWVTVALGEGAELGLVIVAASDGRRMRVPSYEDALTLARGWRGRAV